MPRLDAWEQWMQEIVREMIRWLNSRDTDIATTPLETRGDNVVGLIWEGRKTDFNIVTFRRMRGGDVLRIGFKLRQRLSEKLEREVRKAGSSVVHSESEGGRLLISLNSGDFARPNVKSVLHSLTERTYEQSVKPRPMI